MGVEAESRGELPLLHPRQQFLRSSGHEDTEVRKTLIVRKRDWRIVRNFRDTCEDELLFVSGKA